MIRRRISILRGENVEPAGEIRWSKRRGVEFVQMEQNLVDAFSQGALLRMKLYRPKDGRVFLDAIEQEFHRSSAIFIGREETIDVGT